MQAIPTALLAVTVAACGTVSGTSSAAVVSSPPSTTSSMHLGAFSVSLSVADLAASRAFYEKLGFRAAGGNPAQNWLILRNQGTTIGLFQGMFEGNLLTFNPGWDQHAQPLADFTDVRDIQRALAADGVTLTSRADEGSTGPASITLVDPDGNVILIDQHVPRAR